MSNSSSKNNAWKFYWSMLSPFLGSGKNLRTIFLVWLSVELILVNGLLNLFILSPLLYKWIKSGKILVLSRWFVDAPVKFVASEPMYNVLCEKVKQLE